MISTKIKVYALMLFIALCIHNSDEFKFLKKIGKPFEAIGKAAKKIVNTVGKGIKTTFKNSSFLIKNIVVNSLKKLIRNPILKLLAKRKKIQVVTGEENKFIDAAAPPNEAFIDKVLRLHNQRRTEAQSNSLLRWDNGMATEAEDWVKHCQPAYKHFGDSRDLTYGQNIHSVKGESLDVFSAIEEWAVFKNTYVTGAFKCQPNQDCYPYLQMVWPKTSKIGCAIQMCPYVEDIKGPTSLFVCFYNPI